MADNYRKSCTGTWIVAPITRAVDDKTAKTLLGQTFKRQLKYDGAYSSVTFICSKTDDISVTEAAETFNLPGMIDTARENAESLMSEITHRQKDLNQLNKAKKTTTKRLNNCDAKIENW